MRLYKKISPVVLFILIIGTLITSDSFAVNDVGGNFKPEKAYGRDVLVDRIEDDIVNADILRELDKSNYKIIEVALGEVGNIGGQKFWSWYGFNSYQPWCCCFVSWCADQCGFIEDGIIPKFAQVAYGYNWFKMRNQWLNRYDEPLPGMIIFFDFVNHSIEPIPDGAPDHVGIVKKVEDGIIYCIEGNYNNTCAESSYTIGNPYIFGYGAPNYK